MSAVDLNPTLRPLQEAAYAGALLQEAACAGALLGDLGGSVANASCAIDLSTRYEWERQIIEELRGFLVGATRGQGSVVAFVDRLVSRTVEGLGMTQTDPVRARPGGITNTESGTKST